jgi:hypothetical protein
VDYVTDQITKSLVESVNKKVGSKSGVSVKPFQVSFILKILLLQSIIYFFRLKHISGYLSMR